ncbi:MULTISPECIES: response regulator [Pseudomonas syringae group]|uniref:Response regulator n=3 Tax=Pseudomonas syringae group TaxID=136849 RepID=A0AAD0GQF4_9PSED|nr:MULTISPECIES: response regulator [Pseudomonas syringae group]MDU8432573.1 response regulator [Pseudomonas syringae pv. actinidifoliorum]AVB18711.1 response regulator [Pseudomonas avellanae]EGH06760.1 response regulator receiver protein [Pseudomonas amygdali pv. morsprunorum str. M302280]MDU8523337.1 response regulator [Pseudomonas syringae pv. actinidifoliorum]MDU8529502.1 response regulator [Pseudomonas syringae pv. actinidifoliorum]
MCWLIYLLQSKTHCALLITDFTLPGQLDGKELAMMVHQRWPSTPILVTTGYGAEVSRGLPPGIAFLQKPWSLDELVHTARYRLNQHINAGSRAV